MLFVTLLTADGPQLSDIAVVRDEGACRAIAEALNEHPKRPPELKFSCRPAPKVVKS